MLEKILAAAIGASAAAAVLASGYALLEWVRSLPVIDYEFISSLLGGV